MGFERATVKIAELTIEKKVQVSGREPGYKTIF
jgi:hypothetical protein